MNKQATGKRLTREERRRIQRRRANLTGILIIGGLLSVGFLAGKLS